MKALRPRNPQLVVLQHTTLDNMTLFGPGKNNICNKDFYNIKKCFMNVSSEDFTNLNGELSYGLPYYTYF